MPIKLFLSFTIVNLLKKLACLSMASSLSLAYYTWVRPLMREETISQTRKYKTKLTRLACDKHSSLFFRSLNDEEKSFIVLNSGLKLKFRPRKNGNFFKISSANRIKQFLNHATLDSISWSVCIRHGPILYEPNIRIEQGILTEGKVQYRWPPQ